MSNNCGLHSIDTLLTLMDSNTHKHHMLLLFNQLHIGRYAEMSNNCRLYSIDTSPTLMDSNTHKHHVLLVFDQLHIGRYVEMSNDHGLYSTNTLLTLMDSNTHKCTMLLMFDQMHIGRYAKMSNNHGLCDTDTLLTLMNSKTHKHHVLLAVKILSSKSQHHQHHNCINLSNHQLQIQIPSTVTIPFPIIDQNNAPLLHSNTHTSQTQHTPIYFTCTAISTTQLHNSPSRLSHTATPQLPPLPLLLQPLCPCQKIPIHALQQHRRIVRPP